MPLLEIRDLKVNYGSIKAIRGVSMQVEEGQIVALIGANGAGKTTIMRTIMGLERPAEGEILYQGEAIQRKDTGKRVAAGITLVPEGRHVFHRFSVKDNLLLGAYGKPQEKDQRMETVFRLFPVLKERKLQSAGTLSGGEQQMLALGRALMADPKILLLDEPSLGLAPIIVKEILSLIQEIRKMGKTILLVEQNARSALKIADRGYVLETGKIVLEGQAHDLLLSDEVRQIYLGRA